MWEDELQRSFAMEMVQDVERSLSVERARSEEMQQNLLRDEMEQYRLDLERKVRVKQRQLDELEMRVEGEDEAARAIRKMHGALTDELEEATCLLATSLKTRQNVRSVAAAPRSSRVRSGRPVAVPPTRAARLLRARCGWRRSASARRCTRSKA